MLLYGSVEPITIWRPGIKGDYIEEICSELEKAVGFFYCCLKRQAWVANARLRAYISRGHQDGDILVGNSAWILPNPARSDQVIPVQP